MISTWIGFDQMVEAQLVECASGEMLRAHLAVLLTKNMITYQTSLDEVRHDLKVRYDVEYSLSSIEDELAMMQHEEQQADMHITPNDFFEGYNL